MKVIRNPSAFHLMCEPLGREIRAGKFIEVSDAEAARVVSCVFIIEDEAPKAEEPKKAPATRKTEVRGSEVAEVTTAPACETR